MWTNSETTDDGDILTIEVYGGTGGDDAGGTHTDIGLKAAADKARDVLRHGGEILIICGGIGMLAGGYTAWTGGGAGLFVGSAVGFGLGLGAWWLSGQLDGIVNDPPQPDFAKPLRQIPAPVSFAALQPDRLSQVHRAVRHLNHLVTLAPNVLDAMERRQGAALAKDTAWSKAWAVSEDILLGQMLARMAGLAEALDAIADGQCFGGAIQREALEKGLTELQAKKTQTKLVASLAHWGFPQETVAPALKRIMAMKAADLPDSADPGAVLRQMAGRLRGAAVAGLAGY